MSFSLGKNTSRNNDKKKVVRTINNRQLMIGAFNDNVDIIVFTNYSHEYNLFVPKYIPTKISSCREIVIYNDTPYKLYLHTHIKITLNAKTNYLLKIDNIEDHKISQISIHKKCGFNKYFLDVSKITLYPYYINCDDILPNPNDHSYNQLTLTGNGGNIYLPHTKNIDMWFGSNLVCGYHISFKINNCSSSDIIINLQDQKEGVGFNNKTYTMKQNEVCEITIFITSRLALNSIAGIRRIV
jgi:hypothetical protein